MKLTILCFLLTTLLCCFQAASSPFGKPVPAIKQNFSRVLVVTILPEEVSILRKQIENEATINLRNLGYPAISAFDHFGAKGIAYMGEEATYNKLCNSGIDIVLTLAFIHKTKEKSYGSEGSLLYPGSYYYNRTGIADPST